MMKAYLVGGCVRDELLGLPIQDRDWVVVGETPDSMVKRGFRPVGKDFPVFLHPDTHEEYALARTERKSGHGYKGFTVHASPDVTLEEDLARRDLTINAIAKSIDGVLIDPYGGQVDLKTQRLRHVSPAFVEDPVRVLRLARFAARFQFDVADETQSLISDMIAQDELSHLVPERIWQELSKALQTQQPSLFFTCLRKLGALEILFPDVDRLFGVPQEPRWHPEIDTGVHVMMVLDQAAKLSPDISVRFAALCHDLGKGLTPDEVLPRHTGHEASSVQLTKALCEQLRVPAETRDLALKVAEHHTEVHLFFERDAEHILSVLEQLDSFRKPERFAQYLLAGEADFKGRPGYENLPMPSGPPFMACFKAAQAITAKPFVDGGLKGPDIAEAIRNARKDAIKLTLQGFQQH
jgi:tRNA nucleotidyltransferase (CCA-adding enzyme)